MADSNNSNNSDKKLSDAKSDLLAKLLSQNNKTTSIPTEEFSEGILSSAQQRLFYVQNLDPESGFYNVPSAFEFNMEIDSLLFKKSIDKLAQKHKILRISYHKKESSELIQKVNENYEVDFIYVDFSNEPAENIESTIEHFILEETKKALPLDKPPVRYFLLKQEKEKYIFLFIAHHIMIDGWTTKILLNDLIEFYDEETGAVQDTNEKCSYINFALWEKEYFDSREFAASLDYWKNKLQGQIEPNELPKDYIRKKESNHKGDQVIKYITCEQLEKISNITRQFKTTNFIFFYSCLTFLLHKLTSKSDIVVGTQVANRKLSDFNNIAGLFANTAVLRTEIDGQQLFSDLLKSCSKTVVEAYTHQYVPFDKIVEMKEVKRDLSINPIFQVMLVYQVVKYDEFKISKGFVKPINFHNGTSKFDLDLSIVESAEGVGISFEFDTELFKKETIERFVDYYINIVVQDDLINKKVCDIDILSPAEKIKITSNWNATETIIKDMELPIHRFIERKAVENPEVAAILLSSGKVSRKELSDQSNQIAWWINSMNLGNRPPIGICLDRSVNMVCALLGIVKAGSPYLPIDPILPKDRIEYMIKDSQVPIIITSSAYINKFQNTQAQILNIDEFTWNMSTKNLDIAISSNDLLYIIYTSGTSGRPKGVMLNHKGRVSNFFDFINRFHIGEADRVLSISALSFDMTAFDVFGTLASGAAIVLPNKEEERDPEKWYELMTKYGVTIWHSAPALLKLFIEKLESGCFKSLLKLRVVLLGGDWIPLDLQERLSKFNGKMQYISLGGATEVSMDSTIYEVDMTQEDWNSIPYGYPMANQRAYVLDSYGFPAPIGVAGELCLGGIGVGYGYFNQPRLTSDKFIPDPYWIPGTRMYRTGDLARYHSDGSLELLGRIDFQIKIDGYRIEAGEIEAHIKQYANIEAAVVSVCKDKNGKDRLVAYYTTKESIDMDTAQLRRFVADKVTYYMVPVYFMELEEMPLSPNGKVNRKAFPNPLLSDYSSKEIVLPKTERELLLSSIWSSLLNLDIESVNSDFFELGGDSIKAIQIVSEIRKSGYSVELKDIIKYPTILELAQIIVQERDNNLIPFTGEQSYLLATNQYDSVRTIEIEYPQKMEKNETEQWLKSMIQKVDTFKMVINNKNDKYQQYYTDETAEIIFTEQETLPNENQLKEIMKTFTFGAPCPIHAIFIKSDKSKVGRLVLVVWQLFVDLNSADTIKKLMLGYSKAAIVLEQSDNSFSIWAESHKKNNSEDLFVFLKNAKRFSRETTLHANQIRKLFEITITDKKIAYLSRIDHEQSQFCRIGCCGSFDWKGKPAKPEALLILEECEDKKFLNVYISEEIADKDNIVDKYFNALEEAVNLPISRDYTPTPMQRHMFKLLYERSMEGLYSIQSGFFIPGVFNRNAFVKAYEYIVERYEILRAYFITDRLGKPRIGFLPNIELPLLELDWSCLSEEEVKSEISKLSKVVRSKGFEINQAPLWSMYLITISPELTLYMHFNCYILLDGWSMLLLRAELLEVYKNLCMGWPLPVKLDPVNFSNCCDEMNDLDINVQVDYWKSKIEDIKNANSDFSSNQCKLISSDIESFKQKEFTLEASLREKLVEVSYNTHLTKTALITFAWGKMMARRTKKDRVMFGVTTSGRTVEVLGIDNVVGLFINTIPITVDYSQTRMLDEAIELLRKDLTEVNGKEQIPLYELQNVVEWDQCKDLFDVILVFDNYPVDNSLKDLGNVSNMSDLSIIDSYLNMNINVAQTEFPLRVDIWLEGDTKLILSYYQNKFSEKEIYEIYEEFADGLEEYLVSRDK